MSELPEESERGVERVTPRPRLLALDFGRKRIGLAMTDGLGLTVQPLFTLHRTTPRADVKSIGRVVRKHGIAEVVVGYPLHMSGEESAQAARAREFAEQVSAACGVPVHLSDERLTTAAAHEQLSRMGKSRQEHKGLVDQVAAVLILEGFLADREFRGQAATMRATEEP